VNKPKLKNTIDVNVLARFCLNKPGYLTNIVFSPLMKAASLMKFKKPYK
jgi:hypothetical protein